MNNKTILEKLIDKKDLSSQEIKSFIAGCNAGELSDAQIAAFLFGLRMKGETVEEIRDLIKAMRDFIVPFPVIFDAIDTCGTGGDGIGTFNISTTVAFVVAGAGIPVVKHGNKAASSLCGSADVLEKLDVTIHLKPEQAKRVFDNVGMVFLFAPLYHPAMKQIAPVRKALGTRTVFNYLGPFLNPAKVKRQLIGVPDILLAEKLAKVAVKLGYEHLLIVVSDNGMDEIGLTGTTKVYEIKGTEKNEFTIDPQKLGFKRSSIGLIRGGDASVNAKILKEILRGEKSAKRDIVVLNSAYAIYVSGKVTEIAEAITLAEESIDSGAAENVLNNLIKESKQYAK